ncbi:MAG TPA: winged helix-turn-helix domain-containing protein [Rhizomicrobium sp.]|nr:winged helix-turn-helix domain-containing protein [Rhizomicrobium sp.]
MPSFDFVIDEKSRAGSRFMSRVNEEVQRALAAEKDARHLTQQAIAEKLHVDRSAVNRRVMGLENMTARTIGELFWALGWEPYFEARRPPAEERQNEFETEIRIQVRPPKSTAPDEGDVPELGKGMRWAA